MFESAELPHQLTSHDYRTQVPALREALLDAQFALQQARTHSVLIIVGGVDGAGKGDTINLLSSWLDPRQLDIHAFDEASDEEKARPEYFRFFRRLPARGKIGIHFGSWHSRPILQRAYKQISRSDMDAALARVCQMEQMLANEGVVLVKLWFHLSHDQQQQRLQTLSADKNQNWRVTDQDWERFAMYERFRKVSARALRETSTDLAPWHIIPGAEPNYRHITVGNIVLGALRAGPANCTSAVPLKPEAPADGLYILQALDTTLSLSKRDYRNALKKLQKRLNLALRHQHFRNRALALVFEGWDAAGKGGAIRRVVESMDVRSYHITPIAAPSEEEKAHPYLWRFWQKVPKAGHVAIFDRSWYGRVLVERVEGFCSEDDWMRAYTEINEFEEQLHERGTEVIKFWLNISPDEQLRRFQEREATGFKRHKITAEDWRNRDKWPAYEQAVHDMVERTSSEIAPWTLVEAEDKLYARIKVLQTVVERLEKVLQKAAEKEK